MLCPYCGHFSANKKECDRCRGLFEPLSRQASQNGMGPWFIRDEGNPFRPGCSYATMKMLVARKRIVPESVIRGPSSRQFWTFAKNTPGIAHLLGECHACHQPASPNAANCTHCNASFGVEEDRQYLGLAEVRLIPGQAAPETIARGSAARPAARPAPERSSPSVTDPLAPFPLADEPAFRLPAQAGDAPIESDQPPPEAFEPIRHPERPGRPRPKLTDAEIDELLKRGSSGAERAKRGTGVVVALIVAAGLCIALIVALAIAFAIKGASNQAAAVNNATNSNTAASSAPAASPAPSSTGKPTPTNSPTGTSGPSKR